MYARIISAHVYLGHGNAAYKSWIDGIERKGRIKDGYELSSRENRGTLAARPCEGKMNGCIQEWIGHMPTIRIHNLNSYSVDRGY